MKNLKSIFYICIAVMLVFGMTACSDATGYKVVSGITASTSKSTYIEGQLFDPSTVSATVEFTDGSTKTISGNQLAWSVKKSVTDSALSNGSFDKGVTSAVLTVEYGGVTSNPINLDVVTVKAVKLANLPTTGTWSTTASGTVDVDTKGVTGEATLSNGDIVELAYPEMSFEATVTVGGATAGDKAEDLVTAVKDGKVSIYGNDYTDKSNFIITYAVDSWTVDVTASKTAFDDEKAYELKFEYAFEGTNNYTYPENPTNYYLNDYQTWKPYLVNVSSGAEVSEREYIDPSKLYFQNHESDIPAQRIQLTEDSGTTYNVIYRDDTSKKATLTIRDGEDYITSVTAKYTAGDEITITEGTPVTIEADDFTYVAEMRSGEDGVFTSSEATVLNGNLDDDDIGKPYKAQLLLDYGRVGSGLKFCEAPAVNVVKN